MDIIQEHPFVVYDLDTGKLLGGGSFNQGLYLDPEAALVAAYDWAELTFPGRDLHVAEDTDA